MPPKNEIVPIDCKPHKLCGRCRLILPVDRFNKCKYSATGYRWQCKSCMTIQRKDLQLYYSELRKTPESKEFYRQYAKIRCKNSPIKILARNKARKLERMPCEKCGDKKVDAHHCDYLKPLDVMWLCRRHHNEWHEQNGEGLNATSQQ